MIKSLSLTNFKSWASLDNLEFGRVTALFGPNGSGKTSIIQLLLALKQTVNSRDRRIFNFGGDERDYVDLGSYEDVVHGHDRKAIMGFDVGWTPAWVSEMYASLKEVEAARIAVRFQETETGVRVLSREYDAAFLEIVTKQTNEGIGEIIPIGGRRKLSYRELVTQKDGAYICESTWNGQHRAIYPVALESFYRAETITQDLSVTKAEDTESEEAPEFYFSFDSQNFNTLVESGELNSTFEVQFDKIYYLGPLRAYPQRNYRWTGESPISVGVRGEFTAQVMLADLAKSRSNGNHSHLVDSADEWLRRLGLVERMELRPISEKSRLYELTIRSRGYNHEANIADTGFGVSQVLPIIVLSHLVPEGSFIILEQPEIHLHPAVQAELADLFLDISLKRNVQFLIESHSEHLLMRLQRRVAERKGDFAGLTENDVKLYFCKREVETSVMEPLKLDEFGRIANWPKDFFGDPVAERRAMTEAMLERKTTQANR